MASEMPIPYEIKLVNLRISLGNYKYFVDLILNESFNMSGKNVITPNIGHLHSLRKNQNYQNAMKNAFLSLPDGWPLAMVGSLKSKRIQRRITGSDLLPILLGIQKSKVLKIAILGIPEKFLWAFRNYLTSYCHDVHLVFYHDMKLSVFQSVPEMEDIANQISQSSPHLVISCFGSPKQEIFNEYFLRGKNFGVAIGAGASLDFLIGRQIRSPLFFRKIGLEWLYRILSNPKRLFSRYVIGVVEFAILIVKGFFAKKIRY